MTEDTNQSAGAGEQSLEDSSTNASGTDQEDGQKESTVEIDGVQVPLSLVKEWKAGQMRQDDYTRKTQELAAAKRDLARNQTTAKEYSKPDELPEEVKAAVETLKKAGFATKDDLKMLKVQEEDEKAFEALVKSYPELKSYEKAIRQIGLTDHRAWEDIAKDYGFWGADKLAKAKAANPVKGVKPSPEVKDTKVDIANMSEKEYATWKTNNLGKGKWA